MQIKFDELLTRELSRKEFLQYIGLALLGITGILGVLKSLQLHDGKISNQRGIKTGYGSSTYGGKKQAGLSAEV